MALLTICTHDGNKHQVEIPDEDVLALPEKGWVTFGTDEKQVCVHVGHIASVTLTRD